MKTMIRLSFVLAAYASVACVGLAFVYRLTAPRIAAAAEREVNDALRAVVPGATGFEDVTGKVASGLSSVTFDRAYVAKSGDSAIGMVIQATGATYKSSTILISVGMDRKVGTVRFLVNADTPGIGTKTAESPFIDQFASKSVDDAFKSGADVQAISGATISSKAVAVIIKEAGFRAGEYLAANHGGASGDSGAAAPVELAPMPLEKSLSDAFPGAEFEDVTGKVKNAVERSIVITGAWLAKKGGKAVGVAVQAKGQTYKASTLLVAVNLDRTLAAVRVNETTDSRNYGFAMVDPDYYGLFAGKSVDDPFAVSADGSGGDVDAISGSTISSMGFANIVKVAAFSGASYLAEAGLGKAGKAPPAPFPLNAIPEEE